MPCWGRYCHYQPIYTFIHLTRARDRMRRRQQLRSTGCIDHSAGYKLQHPMRRDNHVPFFFPFPSRPASPRSLTDGSASIAALRPAFRCQPRDVAIASADSGIGWRCCCRNQYCDCLHLACLTTAQLVRSLVRVLHALLASWMGERERERERHGKTCAPSPNPHAHRTTSPLNAHNKAPWTTTHTTPQQHLSQPDPSIPCPHPCQISLKRGRTGVCCGVAFWD